VLGAGYKVPQPALKTGHFGKFTVGTLVYIFYAMPRDVLQAHAAQELHARDWRFHRDLKLWFRQEPAPPPPQPHKGAPPPPAPTPSFHYFDVHAWEKREFKGLVPQPTAAGGPGGAAPGAAAPAMVAMTLQQIVAGFLTEEEIRVKA